MAVYKGEDANSMFYYITTNNIRVSFYAFVMGIAFSIGTAWILFRNGIMLGAFQWFFYKKGLFLTSFLTIWIHGTLEISAIVIAGAAGFVLGNSILFPGTLTRTTSLVKGARRAVKICIGLIPIFITAGFLESYVTRMTDAPIGFKLTIILGSLSFIVYYFILLPILLNRKEAFVKPSVTLEEVSHSLEKEDAQNHLTTL
jgi:uncharacterized membrane protein SpoIIM required for sporulation